MKVPFGGKVGLLLGIGTAGVAALRFMVDELLVVVLLVLLLLGLLGRMMAGADMAGPMAGPMTGLALGNGKLGRGGTGCCPLCAGCSVKRDFCITLLTPDTAKCD